MKYLLSLSAALLVVAGMPAMAQKNGGNSLVTQAITAEGGEAALRALKGVSMKGTARF